MFCTICGSELPDGAGFCPVCGAIFDKSIEEQTYVMQEDIPMYNNETIRSYGFYQEEKPIDERGMYTLSESMPTDSAVEGRRIVSAGMIIAIVSALLIMIGLVLPAIDFSHFHKDVDLQYNMFKICKNVALISGMWGAIPIGFIISAVLMLILAFVKIPVLRILPCLLAISMFVLILVDSGNVIEWAKTVVDKMLGPDSMVINFQEVMKSLMCGIYVIVAGIITGFISCFIK